MKQNNDIFDGLGSIRTEKAPKKTIIVYKLMRLENGKLYPLFIDSSEPVKLGVWYDADSPDFATLKKLEAGYYYLMNDDKVVEKTSKKPSKKDVISVTPKGLRYIFIEETDKIQKRYGENRRYYNLGIDSGGAVSMFAMRAGWHAGSLPTMRQIGKGKNKDLRDDKYIWTECEVSADIDYTPEAQKNPDKDLPTKMPKNGYYLKATNPDKTKSQADKVGWYVAGAIKINRIISDKEARSIIDKFNKRTGLTVLYDFQRESGKDFDPKRGLVGIENFKPIGNLIDGMDTENINEVLSGLGTLVYHNSPYLLKKADGSFIDPITKEKLGFDHRFMGKGEGAQVHGWGSYFSVKDLRKYGFKKKSDEYYLYTEYGYEKIKLNDVFNFDTDKIKDNLTAAAKSFIRVYFKEHLQGNNRKISDIINEQISEHEDDKRRWVSIENTFQELQKEDPKKFEEHNGNSILNKKYSEDEEKEIIFLKNLLSLIKNDTPAMPPAPKKYTDAHNYVVEIPDNDGFNYLEWDKPLTEKQRGVIIPAFKKADAKKGSDWLKEQIDLLLTMKIDGELIYDAISSMLWLRNNPRGASKFLRKLGIVGIHYFSKSDGECYVIFDENDAKIVKHELFGLGFLISEPTKQTFYENLYKQLESIVKDDSFEKNGIRKIILSHIPEDYKNDDIEGIVEVFYQRLRALKCGEKGLGEVQQNFKDLIVSILRQNGYTNGKDYTIRYFKSSPYWKNRGVKNVQECWIKVKGLNLKVDERDFDDRISLTNYVCGHIDNNWNGKNATKISDDFHVGDLINYKGFEESIFQIVEIKKNRYMVIELGDRTRTKNEIPFADKDKLQKAVSPLLVKEMELEENNLGNIVEELQPSGLSGFEDEFSKELLVAEMRLLELEKLKDFGEKIGGSAKDRYNGRKSKDSTENVQKTKGFNRLPTQDEMQSFGQACFHTKFKPNVSDFEDLGLNKIVARLCFFHYYGLFDKYAGYNVNSIKDLDIILEDKKIQDKITSYFIENKRHTQNYKTQYFAPDTKVLFYYIDFVYTALSLNLEKDLKDDFDYKNVLKLHNRGDKYWGNYRDKRIFYNSDVPEETKQRVFNLCYENAMNDFPLFRVMLTNSNGVVFLAHKDVKESSRSWRYSGGVKVITSIQQGICNDDWGDIWIHYAELYVKGKELYAEKYGLDEPDKWRFKDKEGLFAKVREGKDWRNGRNAEPKDFIDTFGFRAVEFGETMPQKERWEHLNRTFDSFMDLCNILNIKPENISLGGTLALSFGSRGRGGKHAAAAHYEPTKKVINLTRRSGAGCLAHEWFHAFDNQVCDLAGCYGTEDAYNAGWILNQKLNHYFYLFWGYCGSQYGFKFYKSAVALNRYENRKEDYWQKKLECGARAFEWYVIKKLADKHQINEYLAQIPTAEPDRMNYYPYPHPEDYDTIEKIYDGIFKSVKQEKTETGVTIR